MSCASPQNAHILHALVAEMQSNHPRLNTHALKKACESVSKYPLPLTTRAQAMLLVGVGPAIADFICGVMQSQGSSDTMTTIISPQQIDDSQENQTFQPRTKKRTRARADTDSAPADTLNIRTLTAAELNDWLRDYKNGRFLCLVSSLAGMDGNFLFSQSVSELCDEFGLTLPVARQLFACVHGPLTDRANKRAKGKEYMPKENSGES
jgi:hypothetical protein